MSSQLKLAGQTLTPSWLSGLIVVVAGLAVVAGAAITLQYQGSDLQLLRESQTSEQHTVSSNSDTIEDRFSANQLISDIPLFILWAGVGLLAYSLTMKIVEALGYAISLKRQLHYVHVKRQELLNQALLRFVVRAGLLIIWILYINFTVHVLVPYVVALSYAGSGGAGLLASASYLLGATLLMIAALHLHVIMLRLVLLRPRAFGQLS